MGTKHGANCPAHWSLHYPMHVWVHAQSRGTFCDHGLLPARLLCPWDFPGKNTGVGCQALLQGIFLTQGSNPFSWVSCTAGGFFTAKSCPTPPSPSTTPPPAKARIGASRTPVESNWVITWGKKLLFPEGQDRWHRDGIWVAQGWHAGVEGERRTAGSKASSCRTGAGSLLFLQAARH